MGIPLFGGEIPVLLPLGIVVPPWPSSLVKLAYSEDSTIFHNSEKYIEIFLNVSLHSV